MGKRGGKERERAEFSSCKNFMQDQDDHDLQVIFILSYFQSRAVKIVPINYSIIIAAKKFLRLLSC